MVNGVIDTKPEVFSLLRLTKTTCTHGFRGVRGFSEYKISLVNGLERFLLINSPFNERIDNFNRVKDEFLRKQDQEEVGVGEKGNYLTWRSQSSIEVPCLNSENVITTHDGSPLVNWKGITTPSIYMVS